MKNKKIVITLPPLKPKMLPVTKGNQTMKSKKDYTRKAKHKKPVE